MIYLIWAAVLLGAVSIVTGVAMISPPAAFIAAGAALITGAYVARYLEVQREAS
jgi:hypothetical protein